MPGIRTPGPIGSALTDGNDEAQKEDISFCEHCMVVGIKSQLHKGLWVFNTETKELEQVADPDRDKFMQCYTCGDIYPIYEIKKEPQITDFVEATDDPFDNNPGNMETFGKTPSQSVGLKKYKNKRRIHKDPEVQRFLDRGDDVTNINDSLLLFE